MSAVAKLENPGLIEIHGKLYETVASRLKRFRESHPEWQIKTELLERTNEVVVCKATIIDPILGEIATGHAEEVRAATSINTTSAVEVSETSAVGRALAFLGYAGTEVATYEEMTRAAEQQASLGFVEHMTIVRDNFSSIAAIKSYIADENLSSAKEAWHEIDTEVQMSLWKAPTKGGCFTTSERTVMKSDEWGSA